MTRAFAALALTGAGLAALAKPPTVNRPASPGEPTLITLHHQDAPAEVVFKDLFGQIGRDYINYREGPWPNVTIDATREPYWQVVAKLNDRLGAMMYLRRNGKVAVSSASSVPRKSGFTVSTVRPGAAA